MDLKDRLTELKFKALGEIETVEDLKRINEIRVNLLGKKGPITEVLRGMKDLSKEERPVVGSFANKVRDELTEAIAKRSEKLEIIKIAKKLEKEKLTLLYQEFR